MQKPTGIRQRQLCELLGLDYRTIAAKAKQQGLSTHAYLQQETGWTLKDELYYPPTTENNTPVAKQRKWPDILGLFCLGIGMVIAIALINRVGIEQIRSQINQLGIWGPIALISLRSVSIVIPAVPSTAYSILAGSLFGFWPGITIIAIADLLACCLNFHIAKSYGRGFVQRLVGRRFMGKVDSLSSTYLENNTFLIAGFLMTGLFDFVSYAVGLTQLQWYKFLLALLIAIVVSTPPVVGLGAGIFAQGSWLLGFALLGTFALAMLAGWLNKRHHN